MLRSLDFRWRWKVGFSLDALVDGGFRLRLLRHPEFGISPRQLKVHGRILRIKCSRLLEVLNGFRRLRQGE